MKFAVILFDPEFSGRRTYKVRRLFYVVAAGVLTGAMSVPVLAQTNSNPATQPTQMAAAKTGKVIIESGGASDSDLNLARYKAWDEFRNSHPEIVRELNRNPHRAGSEAFVNQHPALKQLFEANAGLQKDIIRHPGNYLAHMSASRERHRHAESARKA
jgi:hypothetical protein